MQFGTGAFLRGFVDYFIDEANRRGAFNGSIVAVSSTGSAARRALNEQDGLYTLVIQGIDGGAGASSSASIVGLVEPRASRRATSGTPCSRWRAIRRSSSWSRTPPKSASCSTNPTRSTRVRRVVSRQADALPRPSARRAFDYDARRGLIVLPCELIEDNGDELREIVEQLARRWRLGARFEHWLDDGVTFCNTLVDRIVPGVVAAERGDERVAAAARLSRRAAHRLRDLRALRHSRATTRCASGSASPASDPRIVVAPDIRPYRERKVRVLNGAHTIDGAGGAARRTRDGARRVRRRARRALHAPRGVRRDRADVSTRRTPSAFAQRSARALRQSVHPARADRHHAARHDEDARARRAVDRRATRATRAGRRRRSRSASRRTSRSCAARSSARAPTRGLTVPEDSEGERVRRACGSRSRTI